MLRFRLDLRRTEPKPDRRLGIKLEAPTSKRGLGGKLDAYVPPELRYDYKPPSVFAQYKILTAVFVALAFGLFSYWVLVLRASRVPVPTAAAPAFDNPASAPARSAPQSPQNRPVDEQPVYIEPLRSR
jgi:hypothetical protein